MKGVEVAFVNQVMNPQQFKTANWWVIDKNTGWLSVIERIEFKVITRETIKKKVVETSTTETKNNTIAMFSLKEVFSVKDIQ